MLLNKISSFFLIFILTLSTARADWAKIPSAEFSLKAFPKEGTAAHRRDFEALKKYQETRSKENCGQAIRQENHSFEALFEDEASPLSGEDAAKAAPLVSKVMKFALKVSNYHKSKFLRPRPYDTDPSIKPCGKIPGGEKSYPSSHATAGMAAACILAAIFPEQKNEILEYGESVGELRAIVGVHHPSDVEAGQNLGREICDRLKDEQDFQQELKKLAH